METRIIIVDDDWDYLELLKGKLISSGFKNLWIEDDPLKVREIFEKGQAFDIALIDVTMPNMDGLEKHQSENRMYYGNLSQRCPTCCGMPEKRRL